MPNVKSNALLPAGEENGVAWVAGQLADEATGRKPRRLRAVLGIIDARRVAIDADNGQEVATVRFRRIEVLLADDLPAAEKLIRRALEARSGATTLPLELQDELDELFAAMRDPGSTVDPEDMPADPDAEPGGQDDGPDDDGPWPGDGEADDD
jgi:hypothetical protein